MKKAFDQNVSRTKPRLKLGGPSVEPEAVTEILAVPVSQMTESCLSANIFFALAISSATPSLLSYTTIPLASQILIRNLSTPPPPLICPSVRVSRKR